MFTGGQPPAVLAQQPDLVDQPIVSMAAGKKEVPEDINSDAGQIDEEKQSGIASRTRRSRKSLE